MHDWEAFSVFFARRFYFGDAQGHLDQADCFLGTNRGPGCVAWYLVGEIEGVEVVVVEETYYLYPTLAKGWIADGGAAYASPCSRYTVGVHCF